MRISDWSSDVCSSDLAMRVFPLLDRIAAIVRCIQQFTRQPSRHSGFTTRASGGDEPTNSQRLRAVRPHLNRNLIGGTTDTTAANLNTRLHIIESIMKELQRILLRLVLDRVERAIDNGFGDGLLAVQHEIGRAHV